MKCSQASKAKRYCTQHHWWERFAEKILVSIRAKLLGWFGWLCMTLHLSFPSMYKASIKVPFKTKAIGPRSRKQLGLPVSIFLSFSIQLFFRLIPWSIGAPCVHLSAWVSKTWTGRRLRLHSLGRLGGHLWPLWTGQTSCLGVLLAFYVNKGISASFSTLFSYLQHSFLISL